MPFVVTSNYQLQWYVEEEDATEEEKNMNLEALKNRCVQIDLKVKKVLKKEEGQSKSQKEGARKKERGQEMERCARNPAAA